jgi:flagellin
MGELAIKAQDGTMPDDIRALYDTEFQQLKEMVNDVRTAQLNDVNLFDGQSREVTVSPEGDSVTMGDVNLFTDEFNVLTANTTRLTSMEGARAALDATLAAGGSVSIERADIGGTLSRLEAASAQLTAQRESFAAASRIRDTDVALESTRLASEQILAQNAVHALRQANARQGMVLELLRPLGRG